MATRNHIGKTIYVAAALPATNTETAFSALTWVKASGVQQLPQLGVTHGMIDVPDLETGFTIGIKGAATGVDTSMAFRDIGADDAGQTILRSQADGAGGLLSIKIVTGSGVNNAPVAGDPVQYAQGIVHSYQEMQGSVTTHEGFTVSFRQNALTIADVE